jgi:hypothetical protein
MPINLKNLQPHRPKVDFRDYFVCVFGRPKSGKTSLFHAVVKEYYNGDMMKGLLLACEPGYNALAGIVAQDIEKWEDMLEVIDQLVKERNELPFEMVCIDTVDKMWDFATDYIIRKKRREDNKPYKTIQDIPWGAGHDLVAKEVDKQLQRLRRAGFGIWALTHDKDKRFESRDGVSYDKTTVSLTGRARDIILNMADFICFIDIAKEKNEDDVFVDTRYIYFRADSSDLEAGSRFKNVPIRIPYSAQGFLEVFKEAVMSEYEGVKSFDKLLEEQQAEREARIKEKMKELTQEEVMEDVNVLIEKIDGKIKTLSDKQKKEVKEKFIEILGTANFKKETDPEKLQLCLDVLDKVSED